MCVDSVGGGVVIPQVFKAVTPEVSDRESSELSSGSSTKPPRRLQLLCELSVPNAPTPSQQ